jgi:hypothetical protein
VGEHGPRAVGEGASQPGLHQPDRAQVLDDQPAVGLGQPARFPVHEVTTNVCNSLVHPGQPSSCSPAVGRTLLLAGDAAAEPAHYRQGPAQRTRGVEALDLAPVGVREHGEGVQAAIDSDRLPSDDVLVLPGRVERFRHDVRAHRPPASGAMRDDGEEDPRPALCQHPAQLAGALAHLEQAQLRESGATLPPLVPDLDRSGAAGLAAALVANPERLPRRRAGLELREADRLAGAAGGERGEGAPEIHRGFLEDLLQDLLAPREPRRAVLVHACLGGALPAVERVDQVEARPRNADVGPGPLRIERTLHEFQRLVEGETRRPHVPPKRLLLRRGWAQREAERGGTLHAAHPESTTSEAASASAAAYDAAVFSLRVATRRNCFRRPNRRSFTLRRAWASRSRTRGSLRPVRDGMTTDMPCARTVASNASLS